MTFDDLPDILKVPEVAEFLCISENCLREQIRQGRIKVLRFGRAIRIAKSEVLRLMEGR